MKMKGLKKKRTDIWTCQDGTKVRICDMETSHIINSLRMMNRNFSWRIEYKYALERELIIRKSPLGKALEY